MTEGGTYAYKAVLFDLDGTLLDTAPDMVSALDELLGESNRAPVDYAHARAHVSRGALGLIDMAFGAIEEAHRLSLRERYLELYERRLARSSTLFEGMDMVLDYIENGGMHWGVVTNKPAFLTEPLLVALGLWSRSSATVSGDTLRERKPHPRPLLHAAEQIGVAPAEAIYVGDDTRDIAAGNAAGMTTVAALYGFIAPGEDPRRWPADHRIEHPGDILAILEQANRG
ncbi:MAG: phosphoglycolate phosphatase [Gammaproteobacteria bacterium]